MRWRDALAVAMMRHTQITTQVPNPSQKSPPTLSSTVFITLP